MGKEKTHVNVVVIGHVDSVSVILFIFFKQDFFFLFQKEVGNFLRKV
jgi:hypothetical protein